MGKNIFHRKHVYWTLLVLVLAVAAVAILELADVTHIFHKRQSSPIIPSSKSTSQAISKNAAATSDKSTGVPPTTNGAEKQPSTVTDAQLLSPSGTFVSNHRPGQSGTPTQEQSICNTTPGAMCTIQFTKDGVTKSLTSQQTDSSGSTYWSWDIKDAKDIGLTTGSWQVSAVATLNGQTKTSTDAVPLEVQ